MRGFFLFFLLILGTVTNVQAQKWLRWFKVKTDTSFISDRTRDLTLRVFGGTKFTKYNFGEDDNGKRIHYETNDHLNIGIGFNYRFIGLNLGLKMPFINNDDDQYGKTRSLDLQTFIYMRKLVIDLYYQDYTGYFLRNKDVLETVSPSEDFPQRQDLRTRHIGLNAQYVFNHQIFSYRASFLQNEYQKNSAGSFIAGAGIHYLQAKADSAILPQDLIFSGFFNNQDFNKTGYFSFGFNAGYAYTLVINRHFFATGGALGGVGINYSYLKEDGSDYYKNRIAPQVSAIFRIAAGYNSEKYYVGLQYMTFINKNYTPIRNTWQQYQTGNVRFTVAERIPLKGKIKRRVRKLEERIREINE